MLFFFFFYNPCCQEWLFASVLVAVRFVFFFVGWKDDFWQLADGRGRGELKVVSHGFKIPGCLNASLLSQFTASHRILFKAIVKFMEFAFLGAVNSQQAQVKAILVTWTSVIRWFICAKSHSCACSASVAPAFCSFLPSKYTIKKL